MKKYYKLEGMINSKPYIKRKKFHTRNQAFNYMCNLLSLFQNLENEYVHSNHVIDYKFSKNTRFTISRIVLV